MLFMARKTTFLWKEEWTANSCSWSVSIVMIIHNQVVSIDRWWKTVSFFCLNFKTSSKERNLCVWWFPHFLQKDKSEKTCLLEENKWRLWWMPHKHYKNHWLGGCVGLSLIFLKKMHVLTRKFLFPAPFPLILASNPIKKEIPLPLVIKTFPCLSAPVLISYPKYLSWKFLVGVCCPVLQILTLFQTKNVIQFHTRFQTWPLKSIPVFQRNWDNNYVLIHSSKVKYVNMLLYHQKPLMKIRTILIISHDN